MIALPSARGHDRRRRNRLHMRRRHALQHRPRLPDQFQQMMIFHVLDLVREYYKPPVYFIQFAAVELIAQLLAAQAQRVPPGMFPKHQPRIGHAH